GRSGSWSTSARRRRSKPWSHWRTVRPWQWKRAKLKPHENAWRPAPGIGDVILPADQGDPAGGKSMKPVCFATALLVCLASRTPLAAVDLSKIDRRIAKEPTYQKSPKYCLLVFGPEGKTRVWLVLDGNDLYVDRNGNGDLTDQGKKVTTRGFFKSFDPK